MQCPLAASQTGRPFPQVTARRAKAFGFERIPSRAAAAVEKLRVIAIPARPSA